MRIIITKHYVYTIQCFVNSTNNNYNYTNYVVAVDHMYIFTMVVCRLYTVAYIIIYAPLVFLVPLRPLAFQLLQLKIFLVQSCTL